MDLSSLTMAGFELVSTPTSRCNSSLNLDEFEVALPMTEFYCEQMSMQQYNEQGKNETKTALKELTDQLSNDGTAFFTTLRKRRREEIECSGFIPFLKARLLSSLQGDAYQQNLLSDVECELKLEELRSGIMKAFEYDQEEKIRRYSKRLAEKKAKQSTNNCSDSKKTQDTALVISSEIAPPPPLPSRGRRIEGEHKREVPPPPPAVQTPLKDVNIKVCATPANYKRRPIKQNSASVVSGQQQDYCFSNPLKSLQEMKRPSSLCGTPSTKRQRRLSDKENTSLDWDNPLDNTEPLGDVLLRVIDSKFHDIHAPCADLSNEVRS